MASQDFLPGQKFRLYRETDVANTFEFICIGTTVDFNRAKEFEDATTPDCDNPDDVVNRKSVVRMRSWGIKFSGKIDAKRLEKVETDFNSNTPRKYQLQVALTGANGGKTYTGLAHLETLDMKRSESSLSTFEAALRGDGALTTAAVA